MTHDLRNARLVTVVAASLCLAAIAMIVLYVSQASWARPGSPFGQVAAIAGASLLALSALGAMLKRVGAPARRGFTGHIWLGCSGLVLVSAHSGGRLLSPAALLLLALLALMALGVWARTIGALRMAATFGNKRNALSAIDATARARLEMLIADKRAALATLDPGAQEATFSLRPGHWLRTPWQALAYHRLVHRERDLLGTDRSVGVAQAYWRRIHRLIAVLFLAGLLVHIVLVTFFAAYVAEGREIYWWHLAAWDF